MLAVVGVAAADIALGVVVLQRNSRSFTNRCFAAAAATMALWVVVNFLSDQTIASHERLVFLNRLTVAMGITSGMLLVVFALTFPHHRAHVSPLWQLALVPGVLLAVLSITSPLLVADVTAESWGTNIILGPLYILVVVWGILCSAALCMNVVVRYRVSTPREQVQFLYLYIGMACFLAAVLLITGVFPYALGSNRSAQLVPFAALFFLAPTAYAMLRHRLLDIGWSAVRGATYTLLLAVVAAGMVVLAGQWLDGVYTPLGIDPHAGLFLVGLTALLGFQPARGAIQQASDRVFRQQTYDPSELLRQLGEVISTTLDPEAVASVIADEVSHEMKLAFASVAFFKGNKPVIISAGLEVPGRDLRNLLGLSPHGQVIVADQLEPDDPASAPLAACGARVVVPLLHDEDMLGALILGHKLSGHSFGARDLQFLGILAAEAGVSLRNATLFDDLGQRVRELSALNQLASSIGADIALDTMLQQALEQAVAVTRAEAGSIMLLDATGATLRIAAAIGLPDDIVASARERIGEGISGQVASTREALIIVGGVDAALKHMTVRAEITSAIAVPVVFKEELIGVINLSRLETPDTFTVEDLDMATLFAGQLAVAVKNSRLYGDLENTFLGTISSLAAAVDAKDPYTFGHSTEVTEYADALGKTMGLSESERQTLHVAATLHDIGKIGIDSATLHKPGALNEAERTEMERHPSIAADILAPLDFLKDAVPLVLFHHERYAGGGYPSGISGTAIPLGARIISVADSFNAMVSDRPYRSGLPFQTAIEELRDNSGTQFDPKVVAAFMAILAERGTKLPDLRAVPGQFKADPRAELDAV